jgi:hypothetical protein
MAMYVHHGKFFNCIKSCDFHKTSALMPVINIWEFRVPLQSAWMWLWFGRQAQWCAGTSIRNCVAKPQENRSHFTNNYILDINSIIAGSIFLQHCAVDSNQVPRLRVPMVESRSRVAHSTFFHAVYSWVHGLPVDEDTWRHENSASCLNLCTFLFPMLNVQNRCCIWQILFAGHINVARSNSTVGRVKNGHTEWIIINMLWCDPHLMFWWSQSCGGFPGVLHISFELIAQMQFSTNMLNSGSCLKSSLDNSANNKQHISNV